MLFLSFILSVGLCPFSKLAQDNIEHSVQPNESRQILAEHKSNTTTTLCWIYEHLDSIFLFCLSVFQSGASTLHFTDFDGVENISRKSRLAQAMHCNFIEVNKWILETHFSALIACILKRSFSLALYEFWWSGKQFDQSTPTQKRH